MFSEPVVYKAVNGVPSQEPFENYDSGNLHNILASLCTVSHTLFALRARACLVFPGTHAHYHNYHIIN